MIITQHSSLRLLTLILTIAYIPLATPVSGQGIHTPLDHPTDVKTLAARTTFGPDTLVVDAYAGEAELSQGQTFTTVNDALRAAEALQQAQTYSEGLPLVVLIRPNVYWIDDPDDPEIRRPEPPERAPYAMTLHLSHIRLIGLSDNAEDVVLATNRGQTQGADGNFTTFHLIGDDIQAENITFGNYCNVDLIYPRDPSLNRPKREQAVVQAQLIIMEGDKAMARNCRFISRLNLCPFVGARRALFDHCYMECTADALCDRAVYLHCAFTFYSAAPLYATSGTGAVFLDCDFHSHVNRRLYLVKEDSPLAMVDCRWTSDDPNLVIDWARDPLGDQRSCQYNLTLNGNPLTIDSAKPWLTIDLTDLNLLRAYKIGTGTSTTDYNIPNLIGGPDGWDPLDWAGLEGSHEAPHLPTLLLLSATQGELESGIDQLRIGSNVLLPSPEATYDPQALPTQSITWTVAPTDSSLVSLTPAADGSCLIMGTNEGEQTRLVSLTARTPTGLEAACLLTVKPRQLPAPTFLSEPTIVRQGDELTVAYELDLEGRDDRSEITWYRCSTADGEQPIAVAVSRLDRPRRTYPLTEDDQGYYLMATVNPRHLRSLPGEVRSAITTESISQAPRRDSLVTDFTDLPTTRQPAILPGFWTMDVYKPADTQGFAWDPAPSDTLSGWFYGRGRDGAALSTGLLQSTRGARLLFTPMPHTFGDVSLVLTVDPAKTAGQGFGSATGQYMDIGIKFNTLTLSGYALRIIRTPKNDSAVDFLLVRYDNGQVTPLTTPVTAACYRSTCTLRIALQGSRLIASATTNASIPADKLRPNVSTAVELVANVDPNPFGGIAIQHTGTVGQGATMLRSLQVYFSYEE